ncbi:hypothetical protein PENSPDRAFT_353745 [Peniophora sp. CONT]|nr:hypothetical protein PENSPDRAFT_353745 [Peniophora sp. CONT]
MSLANRTDDIQDSEYWVAEIVQIRRAEKGSGCWIHVRWLWAPEEIQALNVKTDISHMGEWERVFCHYPSQSETVVHSDTIEGPTDVYVFDEHVPMIPTSKAFYVRSTFNYAQKTVTPLGNDGGCKCVDCDVLYNPDDSQEAPLRYCATCKVWCHTGCKKAKDQRLVKSTQFSNKQHHAKGLLLSGPAGFPVRPGPASKKARSVADHAKEVNLSAVTKRVPKDIQIDLIALAQTRIVRPLPGNVAGNKAYVLRAREWVREARTPGGLKPDRVKKLEEWFNELVKEVGLDVILAPDEREEAERSALFVCNECGYPV